MCLCVCLSVLSEPITLEPPEIPEGAGPDEIKAIMEKHAAILKGLLTAKKNAIKALGPAALKVTGTWIVKGKGAKSWFKQYGDIIAPYGPNGALFRSGTLDTNSPCILPAHGCPGVASCGTQATPRSRSRRRSG
eukprot:SAG22_NODE_399_length_11094_cov_5.593452_2_plen_134_part_00